jgi:hypothetical protein
MNASEVRILQILQILVQTTPQTTLTLILDLSNRPQKPRADITKKVVLDR